ncbi:MAG TPA: alpha-L-rhamnosidase, partial [Terracidiphilus sp.]
GIQAFRQQMDPMTGEFTESGSPSYSPAALVLLDFTWSLAGVRRNDAATLEWNIRPGFAGTDAVFRLRNAPYPTAEIKYTGDSAELRLNDRLLSRVTGTVRLITSYEGVLLFEIGISDIPSAVHLQHAHGKTDHLTIHPNQTVTLG